MQECAEDDEAGVHASTPLPPPPAPPHQEKNAINASLPLTRFLSPPLAREAAAAATLDRPRSFSYASRFRI